jgi:predicted nucleic acid-binding protein
MCHRNNVAGSIVMLWNCGRFCSLKAALLSLLGLKRTMRIKYSLGCRTLDIIYVAAALVIGGKEFVTFDGRQGALARQAGLTVKP